MNLAALWMSIGLAAGADPFDEATLAAEVWQHAPDVMAARNDLVEAQAASDRSYLLPNPALTTRLPAFERS